jgi:branched-chain amino acid transport system substrate-binding protein
VSTVRLKKMLPIVSVVVMALVGLSACSQTTPTSTTPTGAPIKIGFSVSLTGDFSSDGQATLQGYQLWADTINKAGGLLGRPVQLVYHDDKSDPQTTTNVYKQLITVEHVNLVFGPFSTLLVKPASVVARQYGYAMLEGSGGGPTVFNRGLNNIFDTSVPVANDLTAFALYILSLPQNERPKTAAYATNDDPFTQPQLQVAQTLLESGGVRTVYNVVYPEATTKDVTPYANKVIQSGADVAILGTLLPDITTYIKRFRQEHYNPKAIIATAGPDAGQDFINAVGLSSTEGVFVPNGWYPQANNFENAQMVSDYLAKYGGTADAINADVAEAYSAGQVLAQAVTKINSIDNAKLISELHSDTFNSVQGAVAFDETGQNTLALAYLFQWQHGNFLPVYPNFAAAENPEFPKPVWP